MPYKDQEKQKEYQLGVYHRRRLEFFQDKSCTKCGKRESLELDHIDPAQKTSHKVWFWSRERRETEINKCQVLCRPCHQEKTARDLGWGRHGSSRYNRGCRCDTCRQGATRRSRVYRERKKMRAWSNGGSSVS